MLNKGRTFVIRGTDGADLEAMVAYQMMIKPCGPTCNLDCEYCFYLSKDKMFPSRDRRMSDQTLEEFTRQYIESQDGEVISFAWQGGEPTILGLDFFQRALDIQEKHRRPGMMIENTIQTNGTLLDESWCRFLHDHQFLVGLSVDGPRSLHDLYRRDKKGGPTLEKVIRASRLLHKHRVEFNTLTVINRENAKHPLQVYRFLRNVIGSRYMQFIPCVEPIGFENHPPTLDFPSTFPSLEDSAARPGNEGSVVTDWSVDPVDFGSFLVAIFDEWVRRDVGRVFVINFEVAVAVWMGLPSSSCTMAENCGRALAIEHDGSVYSCDHYVYPDFRLGNIQETGLATMVSSERQCQFGEQKYASLPRYCRECNALFACWGECPKNRFIQTPEGEPGLNYLCKGLRTFFTHADPWLAYMANEVRSGRDAANVMRLARERNKSTIPSRSVRLGKSPGQ